MYYIKNAIDYLNGFIYTYTLLEFLVCNLSFVSLIYLTDLFRYLRDPVALITEANNVLVTTMVCVFGFAFVFMACAGLVDFVCYVIDPNYLNVGDNSSITSSPNLDINKRELFNACYTDLYKSMDDSVDIKDVIANCMIKSGM